MKTELRKMVANGYCVDALSLFSRHHALSSRFHFFTFPSLLKACGNLQALHLGKLLHGYLTKVGFHRHVFIATALTSMYMKFGILDDAMKVFDEIPSPPLESFNAAISGLAQSGLCLEALATFKLVRARELKTNSVCLASVLPACEIVKQGSQLHCFTKKFGFWADIYASTSIVTMYMKFGEISLALRAFKEMEMKNTVSYNTMITGLLQNGALHSALYVFKDMRGSFEGYPNSVTFISTLSACSFLLFVNFSMQLHGIILKVGMCKDTRVGTSLIDAYSKNGQCSLAYMVFRQLDDHTSLITWNAIIWGLMLNFQSSEALSLFHQLGSHGLVPDSITWNSIICGFSHMGKCHESFMFFERMLSTDTTPSLETITTVVSICSATSNLGIGKSIHGRSIRDHTSGDEYLSTSFIDMYMNSGNTSWARRIFSGVDTVSDDPAVWNAMIFGYGRNGENENAFEIFDMMCKGKVAPNAATVSGILYACSQSMDAQGRVWEIFKVMKGCGLIPTLEQFACVVDILRKCGRLEEAHELIRGIPQPSSSLLASFLGACQWHSNSRLGEESAEKLIEMEPHNPLPFVVLSNIYAAEQRWSERDKVRGLMEERGLIKAPAVTTVFYSS